MELIKQLENKEGKGGSKEKDNELRGCGREEQNQEGKTEKRRKPRAVTEKSE